MLLPLSLCLACSENIDEEVEYVNWKAVNAAAFRAQLEEAKSAIAAAQAAYGADWQAHCPWRVFRTYAQDDRVPGTAVDSICVKIVATGSSTVRPMYNDSVMVNYLLRLQPSASYPDGKVADHSGPIATEDGVFHPDFAQPASLLASNTVEGFTTALLHMHEGDRWLVYIPQELGYGGSATNSMPAYSMLTFDMQLVRVKR